MKMTMRLMVMLGSKCTLFPSAKRPGASLFRNKKKPALEYKGRLNSKTNAEGQLTRRTRITSPAQGDADNNRTRGSAGNDATDFSAGKSTARSRARQRSQLTVR